jgi:hypothetical protein
MSLLNDIKKKGNILEKNDIDLLRGRILELRYLIDSRITLYGLPKSRNDLTIQYCNELKDINKFLGKYLKDLNKINV